jgi:hypothetical protein
LSLNGENRTKYQCKYFGVAIRAVIDINKICVSDPHLVVSEGQKHAKSRGENAELTASKASGMIYAN